MPDEGRLMFFYYFSSDEEHVSIPYNLKFESGAFRGDEITKRFATPVNFLQRRHLKKKIDPIPIHILFLYTKPHLYVCSHAYSIMPPAKNLLIYSNIISHLNTG